MTVRMNKVVTGCLDGTGEEDVVVPKVVGHFETGVGFRVGIED